MANVLACAQVGCGQPSLLGSAYCGALACLGASRPKLTVPADVADLFVATCERLIALGATHVSGFGMQASFAPVRSDEPPREKRERSDGMGDDGLPKSLNQDEREMAARARHLMRGDRS